MKVWAPGEAGQIVLARVEDSSVRVTEAWTGPQVAWKMARGYDGAFGRKINDSRIWLSFCAVFLLGLANWRKPLSLRNLDLLALLSFSISLWFFNRGEIFRAMPLVYPPLLYLLGRVVWIAWRGRGTPSRAVWPVWLLLGATVFLAGFKIGLNLRSSNVIDVGYAGVIGAERIASEGQMPYGHMPTDDGKECGKADADGYVRERIQENGRCESANDRGDTYGPASYLAYVPGLRHLRLERQMGDLDQHVAGPPGGALHRHLSSTCSPSSGWASSGAASAASGSGPRSPSRGRPTRSPSTSRTRTRTTRSCRRS